MGVKVIIGVVFIMIGTFVLLISWNEKMDFIGTIIIMVGVGVWYWSMVESIEKVRKEERLEVGDIYEEINKKQVDMREDTGDKDKVLEQVKEELDSWGRGSIKYEGNEMYKVVIGSTVYDVWVEEETNKVEYIIEGTTVIYGKGIKYREDKEDEKGDEGKLENNR